MNSKVIIGLPAFNEENGLTPLLEKINNQIPFVQEELSVLIVNDGSTDHTEEVIQKNKKKFPYVAYINHHKNMGLGEAMQTLFSFVINTYSDQDILITLDADNTQNPNIIPDLIHKLKKENLDIVIASRFTPGGREIGLTLDRKIYSRGARLFFSLFFPIPNVRDYSCGFRAYRVGYLRKAMQKYNGKLITSNGFECMAEILARASKIGVKAGEVPLTLEYYLKEGKSKMNVLKTIKGYLALLRRVKLSE